MFNKKKYIKKWRIKNRKKMFNNMRKYKEENKERLKKQSKKYYQQNKDKKREYQIKNKDKILDYNHKHKKERNERMNQYLKKPTNQYKDSIRSKTRWKYGYLPNGFQYHHTTNPYEVDKWIGIYTTEHYKFHSDKRVGDL